MTTADISSIAKQLNSISIKEQKKPNGSNRISNPFAKVVNQLSPSAIKDMHTAVVNKMAKTKDLVLELFNFEKLQQILNKKVFKDFVSDNSRNLPNSIVINTIMFLFNVSDFDKYKELVVESVYNNIHEPGVLEMVYQNIFANDADGQTKMRELYNDLLDMAVNEDDIKVFDFLVNFEQYDCSKEKEVLVFKFSKLDLAEVQEMAHEDSNIADYIIQNDLEQRF